MNRILYLLVGLAFAGMVALAFSERPNVGGVTSKDVQAGIGFCLLMGAGACVLIYSRRGRAWRQRFDQKTIDTEDRERTDIRTKGKVPPPRSS